MSAASAEDAQPRTPRRPPQPRWRRLLRLLVAAVALAALVAVVVRDRQRLLAAMQELSPLSIAVALVAVLAALTASMFAWRAVLEALGSRLPVLAALRVYFLGALGKYVPGSVWQVVAQTELGREYDVPGLRSAIAGVLILIVSAATGVVVGAVALVATDAAVLRDYWWVLLTVMAGLPLLYPRILDRVLRRLLRLARRPEPDEPIRAGAMVRALAWSTGSWLLFGAHIAALAASLGGHGTSVVIRSIGAFALAWVAGFVVVFAPAGAGPRELILTVVMTPAVGRTSALVIALASRLLGIAGDLISAGAAIVGERLHSRHQRGAHPVVDRASR